MLNLQRLLLGLIMLLLLSSPAASWTITFYETMDGCTCTKAPCRKTYLSYEGSNSRSDCIHTGLGAGNSNCVFTYDGGATFGACDYYITIGAFAIGADTQCDWGHICSGSGSAVQHDECQCYNATQWEPEFRFFSCADSSDPPQKI